MTGTMRLPLGRAVAMPILISFLMMILSPSKELFIRGYFLMQCTIASMKRGVKVIFVPSLFSNPFFTFSLQWTRLVTSASVKLVTWGLVWTLRTIWSAISRRMRSISMISTLPVWVVMGEEGADPLSRAGAVVVVAGVMREG